MDNFDKDKIPSSELFLQLSSKERGFHGVKRYSKYQIYYFERVML